MREPFAINHRSHFWTFDKETLTASQISFAKAMWWSVQYKGNHWRRLINTNINEAHFGRRQILMSQVLEYCGVDKCLADEWLSESKSLSPWLSRALQNIQLMSCFFLELFLFFLASK